MRFFGPNGRKLVFFFNYPISQSAAGCSNEALVFPSCTAGGERGRRRTAGRRTEEEEASEEKEGGGGPSSGTRSSSSSSSGARAAACPLVPPLISSPSLCVCIVSRGGSSVVRVGSFLTGSGIDSGSGSGVVRVPAGLSPGPVRVQDWGVPPSHRFIYAASK